MSRLALSATLRSHGRSCLALLLWVFAFLTLSSCDLFDETRIMGPEPPPRPSCIPAPSGVVSWWPGDGSNRDVVGTNHVELENGVGYAPGMVGEGFWFDGVDDYAGSEADGIGRLETFSIEAWVRLEHLTGNPAIVTLGPKAALHQFELDTRPNSRFWVSVDGEFPHAFVADVLEQGVFAHIAGTFGSDSELRLYVDGEVVASGVAEGGTVASTDHVVLSGEQAAFPGVIDEITVYDRALTPEEVRAIAEAGGAGKCIPPAG